VNSRAGFTLFSRNRKSLNRQFPYIVEALADLPEGTVVDGEVVAIDDSGRPNFNLLQNFRADASRIQYYVFDLVFWKDRDLTRLPLIERRMLLKALLVVNDKRIRITDYVEAAPADLLAAVREQGLEGIIAKQKDSHYQPGKRSGAWIKLKLHQEQEMVIGGYTDPRTGQPVIDPDAARELIDMLDAMHEKTKGNLAPEEDTLLLDLLGKLKMAYLEVNQALAAQAAQAGQAAKAKR